MAQILDLGKLRFNWAGAYYGSTTYGYNDVVTYGPNVYAYTNATASSGNLPTNTSYWALVIQGYNFRGTYTNGSTYYLNDLVFDGTSTYVVTIPHTASSSVASGNSNLTVFALGQPGLPAQTGKANYVLSTNGTTPAWATTLQLTNTYVDSISAGASAFGLTTAFNGSPLTDTMGIYAINTTTDNSFGQFVIANLGHGTNVSTDFIAYSSSGNNDHGWVDMGITSYDFSAAVYGITGPGDAYIFGSHPTFQYNIPTTYTIAGSTCTVATYAAHGYSVGNVVVFNNTNVAALDNNPKTILSTPTSTTFTFATSYAPIVTTNITGTGAFVTRPVGNGNLVLATDGTGLSNSIVFAAGGYDNGRTQMTIVPNSTVNINISTNSTSTTTGALTVNGGAGIQGDVWVLGSIHAHGTLLAGDSSVENFYSTAFLTAPAAVFEQTSPNNTYAQVALRNVNTSSSADFIAYPDNGNDSHGWIDMGITGSTFSTATYGITGPNDGYLFMDAPQLATPIGNGNLVLATGNNGKLNQIVFAAGGFVSGTSQMIITPNQSVAITIATPSTSPTTGALTVAGGVGILGNVNIQGSITFGGSGTQVTSANLAVNAPMVFTGSGSTTNANDLGLVTQGLYTITNLPSSTIIAYQLTNNVATLTTLLPHYYLVGDSITIANVTTLLNGTYTITAVTSNTFSYAKTNSNIALTYLGQVNYTVASKTLTSNVATLTLTGTHAITVGTTIFVTGVDSTFNGTWTVTAIATNTVSFAVTAANVSSTASTGTVTYYTSVSTGVVNSPQRTRYSAWTKHASDGQWNVISNISTLPTTNINYTQNTYGNGIDIVYDKVVVGGLTIQGSGSGYGAPYGSLTIQGNISSPAWTTTGIRHVGSGASTLTDTTSTGTVAAAYTNTFGSNITIAASSAVTYTTYANAYFGTPTAGTNVTITNPYAIYAGGNVYTSGNLVVAGTSTFTGAVTFGQTTGVIGIGLGVTVNAATGATTLGGGTTVSPAATTAVVTAASASAGTITYTATNTFTTGQVVTIGGLSTAAFNLTNVTIASATSAQFTVTNAATGTAVTGANGTAVVYGTTGVNGGLSVSSGAVTVAAGTGNTSIAGTLTVTGAATINGGLTINGPIDIKDLEEYINDTTLTSGTTATLDWTQSNIWYITTTPTGNMTWNVTNAPLTAGQVFTMTGFVTQGATGYVPTTVTINGSAATIRWLGGTVPFPSSSAGKIDIFNFTFVYRQSTWTCFANATIGF